ncbi:MAG: hypothetical protein Q9191_001271 [Dirinaria sp. TL-2023a]
MGFAKKTGRGRLDKWYKLAKEKGYRARAAFKLIQLNRKYGFLEKSKVLLDLCAAPGSWCQVAAESMPASSLIVGVDLAPIKPIPRAITIQSDITTDKCRAMIRQHLKTWKADTVLHDGAPNVGIAWVQDAFSQAELALQALKLATDFLVEGGTFVTKVFRSKDYNALLWVCNQLFTRVEATKPPSSRNVSAEIFVVCRGFKAPMRIDPRFLDPRSVFAELSDPLPNQEAKVFNPEKRKRKRQGYEDGDYTQFKNISASEFIQTADPIAVLGSVNEISFVEPPNGDVTQAALDQLPETTQEVRACCSDLKVLGRKEFRLLLRWRLIARELFGYKTKPDPDEEDSDKEVAEVAPIDEDLRIQEELRGVNEKEISRKKRERRRENERKQKEIVRMQMHMMPPTEIGLEQRGPNGKGSMFALSSLDSSGPIERIVRGKMARSEDGQEQRNSDDSVDEVETDPEGDFLDEELDDLYLKYQERRSQSDAKYLAKKLRKERQSGNWEGFADYEDSARGHFSGNSDSESLSKARTPEEDARSSLRSNTATDGTNRGLTRKTAMFFEKDVFRDIGDLIEKADGADATHIASNEPATDTVICDSVDCNESKANIELLTRRSIPAIHSEQSPTLQSEAVSTHGKRPDSVVECKTVDFGFVQSSDASPWDRQRALSKNEYLDVNVITAEAMTLAQQVASGAKNTYELVDDGFNKYTFHDREGLPEWFLDDESKHSKPQRPISAAGAAAIKEKLRALNARPIKKIQEAKDRKRFKVAQRLEKLRKKSALVADEEGISEKDKAQNIAKLMSKATKKKPKQQVKLVVARGGNRGISGRPQGVKGKYKIVDSRLKKDTRANRRIAKMRHHSKHLK